MIYILVALRSELPNIEDLDSSKIKVWYTGVGKIKQFKRIKLTFEWYYNNTSYYKSLSKKDITKRLG